MPGALRGLTMSERAAETAQLVERLRDLLAGAREIDPYRDGETVYAYCGKVCRTVAYKVTKGNRYAPDTSPLTALCSTTGCTRNLKTSDLPRRYRVSRAMLETEAVRALPKLLDLISPPERTTP